MLSPQERRLLAGIFVALVIGWAVKSCRARVTVEQGLREVLPSLDAAPKPEPPPD